MPIANQHSYGLSGDPIQKAVIVQQEKQREEKVERGGTRLKPEQAIQLTAKVLCNSIHNSSSSTPTYTQNRSGFTSPRPGAQFDSSYSIGLVTVILVFISMVFLSGVAKGRECSVHWKCKSVSWHCYFRK